MSDFVLISYLRCNPLDYKGELSSDLVQKVSEVYMDGNNDSQKLVVFKDKAVRRIMYKAEWWFSIIDVCMVLTDTANPRRYWLDLKKQLTEKEGFAQLYGKIVQFKMTAPDGKMRETDCANTASLFHIIHSVPLPKAEPFKRGLAKVGYEIMQEIEDPELASKRARSIYKDKGYDNDWKKNAQYCHS